MKVIKTDKKLIKLWVNDLSDVEPQAIQQLNNIAKLPYIFKHIAVMPDVHLGKGATVGSVIASKGAISPSAVGVDIGCGMLAIDLKRKIDQLGNLSDIRSKIEESTPVGFNSHKNDLEIGDLSNSASDRIKSVWRKAFSQIGTLGGGNHFIEICEDGEGNSYLMLHTGSRNVGKSVADLHIKKAKKLMDIWMIDLADPDLAYLPQHTQEFNEYIQDLHWCQDYAYLNRQVMLSQILSSLGIDDLDISSAVNCHHNYVARENHFGTNVWVTRKGAVRAREGDMGIIPGSMGTKSYIIKGKGNRDSFCSCSHGAGRKMSRNQARKSFNIEDLAKQTYGVECRKDDGILDEIPGAYKDIDTVMENQKDLVEVVKTLKAVICIKG